MFKVNNRNTRKRCKICSNLPIKTPEQRQWRHSGVFIVKFEHISQTNGTVNHTLHTSTCRWVRNNAKLVLKLQPIADNLILIFSTSDLLKSVHGLFVEIPESSKRFESLSVFKPQFNPHLCLTCINNLLKCTC